MSLQPNGPSTYSPLVARMPRPERGPRDRDRARTDLIIGSQVAVAIVLLLLVVLYVPRPNIRLTAARFETSPCNQTTSSLVVTAYLSLANTGRSAGDVFVCLFFDGPPPGSGGFFFSPGNAGYSSLILEVPRRPSH